MVYEVEGRTGDALRLAGDAEQLAGTSALRLLAQCRRAAILRTAGERFGHADLVRRMRTELDALDLATLNGDDKLIRCRLPKRSGTAATSSARGYCSSATTRWRHLQARRRSQTIRG